MKYLASVVGMLALLLCAEGVAISAADAAAIRPTAGFTANTLPANDDGSTGAVALPFTVNFFGVNRSQTFVNNNGNITFDSTLSTFTPFDLTSTGQEIIAPFFGDVDTRSHGSVVTYGAGTVDGRSAFGVNWLGVDYFSSNVSHGNQLNSFQLVLIDRADIGAGDFDIEFNYGQILWETGNASSGTNGLGGNSARVGYSNGTAAPGSFFELPGSAVNGAFLDGGPAGTSLIQNSLNSAELGRYLFQARSGNIIAAPPVSAVPIPAALPLFASALALLGFFGHRRKKRLTV